jgi:hypothetical protein
MAEFKYNKSIQNQKSIIAVSDDSQGLSFLLALNYPSMVYPELSKSNASNNF